MTLYLDAHKGSNDSELVEQRKEQFLICGKYFINVFAHLLYLFYSGLNLEDSGEKSPYFFSACKADNHPLKIY